MEEKIRENIQFTGRVQGVGFRYKLRYLADAWGVTGWVRNEYDGSVTAQLQGQKSSMDMILQRLSQDRYIILEGVCRRQIPLEENERGFRVRY